MRPNRYMTGGVLQNAQDVHYVDDDSPRSILSITGFYITNDETEVIMAAVVNSNLRNDVWLSDVANPQMYGEAKRQFANLSYYTTLDDLFDI